MDITVNDRFFAEKNHEDFDFVVSIFDTDMNPTFTHSDPSKHIICHFEDTEHPTDDVWMTMNREVRTILSWVSRIPDDAKVLVHCHAGVSRSSAVAWLMLIQRGVDPMEAFQSIFKKRPCIWPNTVVMGIGASFMKMDPDFMKMVARIEGEVSLRRSDSGYM